MASFIIESDGTFSPSEQQTLPPGTAVTFTLGVRATWTTVYVYNTSGTLDRGLFGTSSVSVEGGGTILSTAPIGDVYTLSVSSSGPVADAHGVIFTGHNGTIKVGGN